jgi:transposase
MEHIVGIDLHSDNGYYGIIEPDGKRVFKKRLPNDLPTVLSTLEPYEKTITCIVVESTYNWYWLVDGLMDNGYNNRIQLANPAGFKPYEGLKHGDDKTDAFFLTELKRLGILPVGYIYPKEERPVRDLLRRRMMLVQQRTSHILSFQSLITRQTGTKMSCNNIKGLQEDYIEELLDEDYLILAGQTNISVVRFLTEKIRRLERAVLKRIKLRPAYERLLTVPGIGKILGLTIMLESGDIGRFVGAGNYTSYCRCVKSKRMSNNKKKGEGNRKNGNKYLEWAYVEAANFARRFCPEAKRYYQRKLAKTNQIVATKALASKISKACYFIMRDKEVFKTEKLFG